MSKMSQAPVGHCLGYSMVTAAIGVQRPRPRSRARSCPLLLLTDITCASPHFTRVHGWNACSHSAALISSMSVDCTSISFRVRTHLLGGERKETGVGSWRTKEGGEI